MENIENVVAQLNSVPNNVLSTLAASGLSPSPPVHGYNGDLPDRLTDRDDSELGELLNVLSRYVGYVAEKVTEYELMKNTAEAILDQVQAEAYLRLKDKGLTAKDRDVSVTRDPMVSNARSQVLYTTALWSYGKAIKDRVARNWETVSRRITQRGQDVEKARRESTIGRQVLHHMRR